MNTNSGNATVNNNLSTNYGDKWSNVDGWVRVFDVRDPTRHKKGHTVYKVISRVFPKHSLDGVTEIVVWKRFNDFKKLHKSLTQLHSGLHLKGSVPKFPDAKLF